MSIDHLLGTDIANLAAEIPDPDIRPRTLFEISRVAQDEVRISQWLGYFLQPDEDHGLGTLFFDALLDVLEAKGVILLKEHTWQGDFSVAIEQNHLDLLIYEVESQWAIIIEHKIKANLYNDLESYWNRVPATQKVGVVLAPKDLSQSIIDKNLPEPISFTAITHREWADAIKIRMDEIPETVGNRTAVYVSDLLENINQFYLYMEPQAEPESTAATLWHHAEQLRKIKDAESGTFKYLEMQLKNRLEQENYKTDSGGKSGWHFYHQEERDHEHGLRFWVGVDQLTTHPVFPIYIELYNDAAENVALVEYLRKRIREVVVQLPWPGKVIEGTGRRHNWAHLLVFEDLPLPENVTPEAAFAAQLDDRLFKPVGALEGMHLLDYLRREIKQFTSKEQIDKNSGKTQ